MNDKEDAARSAAKVRLGISEDGTLTKTSVLQSLGGWLGIAESLIPGTAFAVLFAITQNIFSAVVVSGVLSVGFIARQILAKRPLTQAMAGVAGLALTAYLALRPGGNSSDYFLPGLLTNAGYGLAMLLSIIFRWPLLGVLVSFVRGAGTAWRKDSTLMRRFSSATFLWVIMFGTRLLIETPLYLANNLAALSVTKLILGIPWYALFIWFSWLSLKNAFHSKSE